MDKIEYLEEKVEFYRQEVERYKSMILYEKKDNVRKDFLREELEAAEKMFKMFVNINTQVLAWDSIKTLIKAEANNIFNIYIKANRDSGETADMYTKIFDALMYDPELNIMEIINEKN